jgi:hypothetical protein
MSFLGRSKKALARTLLHAMKANFIMELFFRWGEKQILKVLVEKNERNRPIGSQEDKYFIVRNLMKSFEAKYKSGALAPSVRDWIFNTLIGEVFMNYRDRYPEVRRRRMADEPNPTFITLSPTQKCNLACTGCYAASTSKTCAHTLPLFQAVSR